MAEFGELLAVLGAPSGDQGNPNASGSDVEGYSDASASSSDVESGSSDDVAYLSFGPREELDCNGGDDLPRMADSMSLGLAGLRALLGDSSTVSGVPVERPPPDGVCALLEPNPLGGAWLVTGSRQQLEERARQAAQSQQQQLGEHVQELRAAGKSGVQPSKAVGCGFSMVLTCNVARPDHVSVTYTHHSNHDPSSAADQVRLRLAGPVQDRCLDLISMRKKPAFVQDQLSREAHMLLPLDEYPGLPRARYQPSMQMLHALQQRVSRKAKLAPTDVQAVEQLVQCLGPESALLYQPQICNSDGSIRQHLVLVISTPFQQAMAKQFAHKGVALDATFSTNSANYPLVAMLGFDELNRGVPLLFCISSSEAAAPMIQMLEQARDKLFGGTKPPVICDKGSSETAALRHLGWEYFLCLFHYLKDFRAYLRSSDSGIDSSKHPAIMKLLGTLGRAETAHVFDAKLAELRALCTVQHCTQLVQRLERNWVEEKHRWAFFGRVGKLEATTNNAIERCFGVLKYDFLDRRRTLSVGDLLDVLLGRVLPHYIRQRQSSLAGVPAAPTSRQREQREYSKRVMDLLQAPQRRQHQGCGIYTVTSAAATDKAYQVHVADGSCSCGFGMCHHAEAASRQLDISMATMDKVHIKSELMGYAADHIQSLLPGGQPVAVDQHVYRMPAAAGGAQTYVACIGGDHLYCQCWRFKMDGWCPHLHVLAVHLELPELLPAVTPDVMILRKYPAPVAQHTTAAAGVLAAGADSAANGAQQQELDGILAMEQQWRKQLESVRSAGRVLTEQQRAIAALGSRLQRYAGQLTEAECEGVTAECGHLSESLLGRASFRKLGTANRREQGRLQQPTRPYPEQHAPAGMSPAAAASYRVNRDSSRKGKGKRVQRGKARAGKNA